MSCTSTTTAEPCASKVCTRTRFFASVVSAVLGGVRLSVCVGSRGLGRACGPEWEDQHALHRIFTCATSCSARLRRYGGTFVLPHAQSLACRPSAPTHQRTQPAVLRARRLMRVEGRKAAAAAKLVRRREQSQTSRLRAAVVRMAKLRHSVYTGGSVLRSNELFLQSRVSAFVDRCAVLPRACTDGTSGL